MAKEHGHVPRLGVLAHIAHEGHDAHAAGQQQGGGVGLHGEAVAQGPPDARGVAGLEFGHATGAAPHDLEEADQVAGSHVADAEGTGPGHLELAGTPRRPVGAGEAQGEEAAFLAGLAEGDQIQHRK